MIAFSLVIGIGIGIKSIRIGSRLWTLGIGVGNACTRLQILPNVYVETSREQATRGTQLGGEGLNRDSERKNAMTINIAVNLRGGIRNISKHLP